ncbi:MAG: Chaperone SurA [Verrucomicrobiae bacterium]|nr:Chaperone SurA [Verrucomicrobiae bacterium]
MFIAHGHKVRKHARWIMAGVLLLLIPSFVMLFTQSRESDRRAGELPIVRGKPVNAAAFEQMKDLVRAQYVVLRGRDVGRTAQMQDQIKQEAVIQMLLLEKAQAMGVSVSEPELQNAFLSQPVFQNSAGQFDRERLQQFLIVLNNNGVSEGMFEEVLRQRLIIEKLQALVASAAKATPTAVLQAYQPLHESLTVDLVQFDVADYHEPVVVSNELVRTYYDQNQESFRVPAKVKVQYAAFTAEAARPQVKLTDDELTDFYTRNQFRYAGTNAVPPTLEAVKPQVQAELLNLRADRAAADRATEFSVTLAQQTKPDFAKVCTEFGVKPVTTEYISAFDPVPGITNFPDFAAQAHHLSPSQPISDPLGTSNTYYVLEFIDAKPSHIPPFEEVQTEVAEQVKRIRTYAATLQRAEQTITELKKLITAGKTFAQACAALKLKIETPPPFTVADEKVTLPGGGRIQQASLAMPVGAVSDLIGTATGGLVFHLRERKPADVAAFEKDREMITRQILQRDRSALFNDWIQALVHAEQVDFKLPRRQTDESEPPAAN